MYGSGGSGRLSKSSKVRGVAGEATGAELVAVLAAATLLVGSVSLGPCGLVDVTRRNPATVAMATEDTMSSQGIGFARSTLTTAERDSFRRCFEPMSQILPLLGERKGTAQCCWRLNGI